VDDNLGYLFAAFATTWVVIAGYLLYLGQQVRTLREDISTAHDIDPNDDGLQD
jgi:CcmD family protein